MMLEASKTYPAVAKQVISEIGIDVDRYSDSPHRKLLKSLGLGPVTFFDKETFGADFLAEGGFWFTEAMADAPLSPQARSGSGAG
jgi:hypothetical protein